MPAPKLTKNSVSLGAGLPAQVVGSVFWPGSLKVAEAMGALAKTLSDESVAWMHHQRFSNHDNAISASARTKAEQENVRFHQKYQTWHQQANACAKLIANVFSSWNDECDQLHPMDFWRDKALDDGRSILNAYRSTILNEHDRGSTKILEILYAYDLGALGWAFEVLLNDGVAYDPFNPHLRDPNLRNIKKEKNQPSSDDLSPAQLAPETSKGLPPVLSPVSAHRLLGISEYHHGFNNPGGRNLSAASLLGRWPEKVQLPPYPCFPGGLAWGYDSRNEMLDALLFLTPSLGSSLPLRHEWNHVHGAEGVTPAAASRQLFLLMAGCALVREENDYRYLPTIADGLSDIVSSLLDAGANPNASYSLMIDSNPDDRGSRSMRYRKDLKDAMVAKKTSAAEISLTLPLEAGVWVSWSDRAAWLALWSPIWKSNALALGSSIGDHDRSHTLITGFMGQTTAWNERDMISQWHEASQPDPLLSEYPSISQRKIWLRRYQKHVNTMLDGVLALEKPWWLSPLPPPSLPWDKKQSKNDENADDTEVDDQESSLAPSKHPWVHAVRSLMFGRTPESADILGNHLLSRLPAGDFCPVEAFKYLVACRLMVPPKDGYDRQKTSRTEALQDVFMKKCLSRVDPACQSAWGSWTKQILEAKEDASSSAHDGAKDRVRLVWTVFPEQPKAPGRVRTI